MNLGNAALFSISGDVSNNATWDEFIYFMQAGAGMPLIDLSFQLQFRSKASGGQGPGTSAALTLSTAGGELVITSDDNDVASILRVNVPYTTINGLIGVYQADLVSKDVANKLTHWASGTVTFVPAPIAF